MAQGEENSRKAESTETGTNAGATSADGQMQVDRDHDSNGYVFRFWLKKSDIWLVAFTLMLVVVGVLQTCILNQTEQTNRSSNQAYVNVLPHLTYVRSSDKVDVIQIAIDLENNGNTTARNVQWHFGGGTVATWSANPNRSDVRLARSEEQSGAGVIPPKAKTNAIATVLSRSTILKLTKNDPIYFLGAVTYQDIFGARRLTRFCIEIYGPPWAPSMTDKETELMIDNLGVGARQCQRNNCTDNDCQEQN